MPSTPLQYGYAGAVIAALTLMGQPARAADRPLAKTSIGQFVTDLNSDEFLKRKVATRRLIGVGLPAVGPLAAAIQSLSSRNDCSWTLYSCRNWPNHDMSRPPVEPMMP